MTVFCGADSSRGWTAADTRFVLLSAGFPALAGMDPWRTGTAGCATGIPRARGDGPYSSAARDQQYADSPRSRGWTSCAGSCAGSEKGFPALAGMDHAHIAGRVHRRGFPALAGMDPGAGRGTSFTRRIPRARGDGPGRGDHRRRPGGDSPRSRGWTTATAGSWGSAGGFPALAGMDRGQAGVGGGHLGIPRARGDGPTATVSQWRPGRDSPRSRGWTWPMQAVLLDASGFPALAGMDPGASR